MPEYANVTAGTLTVNGHDIAIDPATTTVLDLVNAIDAIDGVARGGQPAPTARSPSRRRHGASLTLADTSGIARRHRSPRRGAWRQLWQRRSQDTPDGNRHR